VNPNVEPLIIATDLQARAVAIPVACETPISAQLFTINESKSMNSPFYSELGASMSVDDGPNMKAKPLNRVQLIDEEKGEVFSRLEVGDIRCLWAPTRVYGFGDFFNRISTWILLNKEQIISSLTGTFYVRIASIGSNLQFVISPDSFSSKLLVH